MVGDSFPNDLLVIEIMCEWSLGIISFMVLSSYTYRYIIIIISISTIENLAAPQIQHSTTKIITKELAWLVSLSDSDSMSSRWLDVCPPKKEYWLYVYSESVYLSFAIQTFHAPKPTFLQFSMHM